MTGAATGASVGGPWGALIGGVVGGVAGGIQGNQAKKAREKSDKLSDIPMEDPGQRAYLNRVRQQERQQRAATDPSSAFAALNARNALGQTQQNVLRASGGNATQGISSMLAAQNNTNQAIMGIGATAGQRADSLLGLEGGLIDNIAARRKELMEYKRDRAYAEYVGMKQNLNNQMSQGLGTMPQIGAGGYRKAGAQGSGAQIGKADSLSGYQDPKLGTQSQIPTDSAWQQQGVGGGPQVNYATRYGTMETDPYTAPEPVSNYR